MGGIGKAEAAKCDRCVPATGRRAWEFSRSSAGRHGRRKQKKCGVRSLGSSRSQARQYTLDTDTGAASQRFIAIPTHAGMRPASLDLYFILLSARSASDVHQTPRHAVRPKRHLPEVDVFGPRFPRREAPRALARSSDLVPATAIPAAPGAVPYLAIQRRKSKTCRRN